MTATRDDKEAELQRLVHELQVHQLELEMQNQAMRESQQLLEESRNRYADLYDFAPIGYCTVDRGGTIRELNIAAATMLGLPRDLLLGRPLMSAALVRDARAVEDHLRRCFSGEPRVVSEVRMTLRDRAPGTLQLISCPIRNEAGDVYACRMALIDVSVAKDAEGRLRLLAESGEVFASSLDHRTTLAAVTRLAVPTLADICIVDLMSERGLERLDIVADPHRVLPVTTARLVEIKPSGRMRAPQEDVIKTGRSMILDEVPDDVRGGESDDPYTRALRDAGITSTMIVPLAARDRVFGALTFLSTRRGRRYSDSERIFAEDIGRRAAMAIDNALLFEHTQAAVRSRDAVMALVSHDLRNPLAVIRLHAAASVKPRPDDTDAVRRLRGTFEAVQRAARNMDRLISDLLDVASLDAGRLSIHTEPHSAASLAAEAIEEATPLADEKGVSLSFVNEGNELSYVTCDRFRVLQVLANLIGNALKFTPSGGHVTLLLSNVADDVRFTVSDDGPGIPIEQQRHIFERFWQASGTDGRGLGLSIAEGIVRAHGGAIWVESAPAHGATFHFTLPRHQPREPLPLHSRPH